MNRTTLLAGGLFVSLALNVFIGGAFLGSHLAGGRGGSHEPPARGRNPVALAVRDLSPEAQSAWRAGSPAYLREAVPKGREARRLARETMQGFGHEPFDPDGAFAKLKRARSLEYEARVAMDRRIVDFAAGLPAEERARFGEALARPALGRGGAADRRRAALPDG
ncbi:periplasmic heavy metal sensor [Phenylobacterium kunshanense]|uniref:Periplasmic heavy metal sensor n=1 Tax=Phenylobacterium kunshanense TaxID=1445034 RepID=A0A328BET3_9CAUL|nr:periplasmic heavy metal sensor [Phenylobacterium kunshanense]RAK65467.1 hypothetical protein DJ019_10920 [Phenylobacterium kunshanense]